MIKDWNNLRYLWALREGGTMRRAGEMLGTSATTVSRHVKTLTEEVGQTLAIQSKGEDWMLTPYGGKLVDLAAEFNQRVVDIDRMGNEDQTARISITSLDFVLTYYLAPHMQDLVRIMPKLKVSLLSSDRRLSLAFNEVDLALRFGRPDEGNLVAKRLCKIGMKLWQPKQGRTQNWVGMTEDLDWTPDMQMAREVFGRGPAIRTSSYTAAKRTAMALGYATIGPDAVMGNCEALVACPEGVSVDREIWSVVHESRRLDRNLAAVKEWVDGLFSEGQTVQSHELNSMSLPNVVKPD